MSSVPTLTVLILMCQEWKAGDHDQFRLIVQWFLRLCGAAQRDLADELQVSESSISRWANGLGKPHTRFQQIVIGHVRERAEAILAEEKKETGRGRHSNDKCSPTLL